MGRMEGLPNQILTASRFADTGLNLEAIGHVLDDKGCG